MISERPAEGPNRRCRSRWEGDLILGLAGVQATGSTW